MLTTGRTLDAQGVPIPGTGFDVDPDGRLGALLAQRTSPLYSDPNAGEWAFFIREDGDGTAVTRNVHIFRAKYAGPPEHIHPTYAEHFEIIQGGLQFWIDGKRQDAPAGTSLTVPPRTRHAFGNPGDAMAAAIIQTTPEGTFHRMIQSTFGRAHEWRLGDGARPPFWDSMALLNRFSEDIVYTARPLNVAMILSGMLSPVTRRKGHPGDDARYEDAAFWAARVEQPEPTDAAGGTR